VRISLDQELDHGLAHCRVLAAQPGEVVLEDAEGLRLLERFDGCRTPSFRADERHFSETVAGPANGDRRLLAVRRHHSNRKPALRDQVERVGWILTMNDYLTATECATTRELQQLPDLLGRHSVHQAPLHLPMQRPVAIVAPIEVRPCHQLQTWS
jgi:hypothetical protein